MLCCSTIVVPSVIAATAPAPANAGQALEIAPPLITMTVNPGQTVTTQIKLRDISTSKLNVTNQINDFVAEGEDGTPKILLDSQSADDPFSLKNWIQPLQPLLLSPQQIETLSVTIKVPSNASPGGHYGIIRFSGTAPQLEGTGVSLSASLGALVLLTVNGKLNDSLNVQEFSVNSGGKTGTFFESAPLQFVVRLNNNGNVQEEPLGHVIVSDLFGKPVAGININLPPRNVLPDSIRKFDGSLDQSVIGNKRLFGRYTAKLTLKYGTVSQRSLTDTITFWVIPFKLIGSILAAIIVGFFALRFAIKRYNRYIINQVQKNQRRSKKR